MRAFGKIAIIQTKLYFREPMSVFFTLLFAPLLLILMGFIFGNNPQPILGGLGHLDISIPSYIGLIIGIIGMTSIPITLTTRRETGVLHRLYATPLKPMTYFFSDALAPFIITLLGIILLILTGSIIYHVRFYGDWLSFFLGICLSIGAFFSLGFALGGVIPNTRSAIVVGNVLIIPMNILSGALIPFEILPQAVQKISLFIPLTHVVTLLKGLWLGESWTSHYLELVILSAMLLISIVIIRITFKWE